MGVTIHYRGTMADLERVEEFEDRVIDMALEIGAAVRLWRSWPSHDPSRVVRGLTLEVAPGHETASLLVSPDGWLIPLSEIEAAEQGRLTEPQYCSVKTQFGSIEGHVGLVELLSFLKQEFFTDLEVSDEGGYWEHRDVDKLAAAFARVSAAVDGMANALRVYSLTDEAAEDPAILAARVERVAEQVHRALARPPEHAPVRFDDGLDWDEVGESTWDESYKEQRRKQERLHRAIQELLRSGADPSSALENAMRDEGIIDLPGDSDDDAQTASRQRGGCDSEPFIWDADEDDEPWRASLGADWQEKSDWLPDDLFESDHDDQHELQRRAADLHLRIFDMFKEPQQQSSHMETLSCGVGEVVGGLAQALVDRDSMLEGLHRGLAMVQLKRALRGAAFANGALFALRGESQLSADDFDELAAMLKELRDGMLVELARIREERSQ